MAGNAAQIIGKVNPDLSVKVYNALDLGTNVGMSPYVLLNCLYHAAPLSCAYTYTSPLDMHTPGSPPSPDSGSGPRPFMLYALR